MKIRFRPSPAARQRGAAALIVLILLFLMVAFIAGNSVTLHKLKRELRLVETRQVQRYSAAPPKSRPAASTNATMGATTNALPPVSQPAQHR